VILTDIDVAERMDRARRALERYTLRDPVVEPIDHHENMTFRVTDGSGGAYLLRLHEPANPAFVDERQRPEYIASELGWLEALVRDTDLTVPEPIRTRDGEFVARLERPDGDVAPWSLLRWVEGEPFRSDHPRAIAHVSSLGRLVAALHDHTAGWEPPAWFVRPSFDLDHFARVMSVLEGGVATQMIAPGDYEMLRRTFDVILEALDGDQSVAEQWGLIHNDLHTGNWLVYGDEARPIDFSLCGWGYLAFDLSIALCSLPLSLRGPAYDGYVAVRRLPPGSLRRIESCSILMLMGTIAFCIPDPGQHDWLRRRVPEIADTVCRRYIAGEPILFTVL
jgi:Ser/Thr protein kinase RdoA (MazF antagonist)